MTGRAHIESMSRAFVNEDAPSFDELPDRVSDATIHGRQCQLLAHRLPDT